MNAKLAIFIVLLVGLLICVSVGLWSAILDASAARERVKSVWEKSLILEDQFHRHISNGPDGWENIPARLKARRELDAAQQDEKNARVRALRIEIAIGGVISVSVLLILLNVFHAWVVSVNWHKVAVRIVGAAVVTSWMFPPFVLRERSGNALLTHAVGHHFLFIADPSYTVDYGRLALVDGMIVVGMIVLWPVQNAAGVKLIRLRQDNPGGPAVS